MFIIVIIDFMILSWKDSLVQAQIIDIYADPQFCRQSFGFLLHAFF